MCLTFCNLIPKTADTQRWCQFVVIETPSLQRVDIRVKYPIALLTILRRPLAWINKPVCVCTEQLYVKVVLVCGFWTNLTVKAVHRKGLRS